MIQFNLLPDVKIEYIKAQQMRQTMLSIATIVTIISVVIFSISFIANQLERKHLSDLNKDIASNSKELKGVSQIDNILTIQNQLNSLTGLHDAKPALPRLFSYLNQLTPEAISLSEYSSDLALFTVTLTGGSDTISSVNKYVDTLKFTTYTTDKDSTKKPAFSNVVLTSFGISASEDPSEPKSKSSFTINFSYDPNLFNNTANVVLDVPSLITTRSEVDKPKPGNELFQSNEESAGVKR